MVFIIKSIEQKMQINFKMIKTGQMPKNWPQKDS